MSGRNTRVHGDDGGQPDSGDDESPTSTRRLWLRRIGWAGAIMLAIVTLVTLIVVVRGWRAFGKRPTGARLERMQASPQWADGEFENPEPLWNDGWGMIRGMFSASEHRSPETPLPVVDVDPARFSTPPSTGLRVTWLGHSTLLIEIDGCRFLTDPVWGERTSPLPRLGPERWYAPPLALDDLPELDAILLSHDHYDHLDYPTIVALADRDTLFVAPLGVGAHLAYWGVPEDRIVELDWWERRQFGNQLEVVSVPARHASGRHVFDQNRTLWTGYAIIGPEHRALFTGDTGLFRGMRDVGERLGPFDVTMIEVGAYNRAWPDWHLGPEQAVRAHGWLRGQVMLPIHWGLFDLAYHGWTEPIERVLVAAEEADVTVATPRPGQSFEPDAMPSFERWWPDVPWRTADEDPIRATKVD